MGLMTDAGRRAAYLRWTSILIAISFLLINAPKPGTAMAPSNTSLDEVLPPTLADFNATSEIEGILLTIDESLMARYIQMFQDFRSRYSYRGDKCFEVAAHIRSMFERNGLDAYYDDFAYNGYDMRNVIGVKQGVSTSTGTVILCGHYDSISTGNYAYTQAPGADDNGSGIAAVMAAAELLSDYDFNLTIKFMAFSGEEQGLKGSAHYVSGAYSAGENITAVINLDMIAYNPDPGSAEVYVVKDYGDMKAVVKEPVYGPAPANDTTVHLWLDKTNIINCALCIQDQGSPGIYRKLTEGPSGDYVINLTTGFIDLSLGIGPLNEFENITGWYNYSPSASLVDFTKGVMLRYDHIFSLTPVDTLSGSSDHASFAPLYPAIMFIERKYATNPNYHKITDTIDPLNLTYCANITQMAIAAISELAGICSSDSYPPSHSPGYPPEGGYATSTPVISIELSDPGGIDTGSVTLFVDGAKVAHSISGTACFQNISYVPAVPFTDGRTINVSISAADNIGNNLTHNWSFEVDAVPPMPPSNFTIEPARIEFVKRGLAINIDTPADAKQAISPTVIFHGGEYKMWYMAMAINSSKYHINYANSSDGITWNKYGIVLYCSADGQLDDTHIGYPEVIFDGEYRMWYSGYDGANWRIFYANSSDGIAWAKRGIGLDIGPSGSPYDRYAFAASVIKTDEYRMWYTGFDGLKNSIQYANSSDGINWNRSGNISLSPADSGRRWGDAMVLSPSVAFDGESYHMWYNRLGSNYFQTHYAKSEDGFKWNDIGLAIEAGKSVGSYDKTYATYCFGMLQGSEMKMWYSGFDDNNWRILFANITPDDPANDLFLDWAPSESEDIAYYEVFRECRPSAFRHPLDGAKQEYFAPSDDLTPWAFEDASEANLTVYGPTSGSDPPYFYLPDDNIIDIEMYLRSDIDAWYALNPASDFTVESISGHMTILTPMFQTGCTLHAWYNHSRGAPMRVQGHGIADIGGGDSDVEYCYVIRAVDKAGNYAYYSDMQGKIGTPVVAASWNLLCNPFLESAISVPEALSGLDWVHARTWDPAKLPNHWTSNRAVTTNTNTLQSIDGSVGVWVRTASAGSYSISGTIANRTINLTAGWNLVSNPYFEIISVSEALQGVPWDIVEVMDLSSPTLLKELGGADMLVPGQGLWVRVTSDSVWNAINVH